VLFTEAEAPPTVERSRRTVLDAFRSSGWLPAAAAATAVAAICVATGAAPVDVLRYAGYAGWAVLLPGVLLYRVMRRTAHTLFEDLALGIVVGLALEVAAWAGFAALGVADWLIGWPLLVVVPFAVVKRLRRHWRPRGYRPVPLIWSWAVAAIVVFYVGYTAVGLRPAVVSPERAGGWYVIDTLYQLSLVGEAKHHFPLHSPHVAAEPLHYHWFAFAHDAAGSLISGVDTAVVFLRLSMVLVGVVSVVAVAAVGWRVSGRPWVGVIASVLTFVVGETMVGAFTDSSIGTANADSWISTSAAYSMPFAVVLAAPLVDLLNGGRVSQPAAPEPHWSDPVPVPALGRGAWVLLALLALAAVGAKSSILPVVLVGAAVVGLVDVVTGNRLRPVTLAAGGVLLGALLFGVVAIYRFESHGLSLLPLESLAHPLEFYDGRSMPVRVTATVLALGAYGVYMLSRLAGLPTLLWLRRGRLSSGEWLLAGAFAAGLGASLLLAHPSGSQTYFVRSAWAYGAVMSAIGYVELVGRHRTSARLAAAIAAGCAAVSGAVMVGLWLRGGAWRGNGLRYLLPVYKIGLVLGAVLVGAAVLWWVFRRRRTYVCGVSLRGVGAVAALTFVLLSGAGDLVQDGYLGWRTANNHVYQDRVEADEAVAARWLRDNSDPDDVVAFNRHAVGGGTFPLAFGFSAFSERRQLVGSWSYVPKVLEISRARGLNPVEVPFWDGPTLADNDAAFQAPNADRVAALRQRYGVRWIAVDRTCAHESPQLAEFAALRFERPGFAIYEITTR
jgi:hypothetical protein